MASSFIARVVRTVVLFGLMAFGLAGCGVLQQFIQPASATLQPPAAPLASQAPALPSATALMLQPEPTYTFLPTYTPLPTYTALPSQTPWIIVTPASPPVYVPPPQPTMIFPTPDTAQVGACCTLRVRNRSSHTYWIGTKMPYGGNYIHPNYYVEFYLPGPTSLQVQYCRSNVWDHLFDCQKITVYVDEVLEQVSIP